MSLRLVLARIGFRWRLAAALGCLLLAAMSTLQGHAQSSAGPGDEVLVATRVLSAGHVLGARDLVPTRVRAAWPGSLDRPSALVGRTLAGPVAKGEPVTALRLVERALTTGLGAELVALPVDVGTDVRGVVRPGGRVDLLAVPSGDGPAAATAAGAPATLAAARVLVLALLPPQDSAPGCRLVVAVRRSVAPRLAGLRAANLFQVAALPP